MHRLNKADDHDLPPAKHTPLADLNGKVCVIIIQCHIKYGRNQFIARTSSKSK
jgi:hypothetical protein